MADEKIRASMAAELYGGPKGTKIVEPRDRPKGKLYTGRNLEIDVDKMTPEMEQSLQEQKDKKMRKKMGEAYDKANVNKGYKAGGKVKCMSKGGGIEVRGKTKGRMV